jgi:thioredoxin
VTDQTFDQEVMRSSLPVLVDFWAPWCGPCRMTDPILKKLAGELGSRLKVAKVNVDENPLLSQRFDVRSIPTMLLVKNGKILDRWMGALPEPVLRSRIAPLIQGL